MVEKMKLQGKTYYLCSLCQMPYVEQEWAQKCEDFCAKYNACSVEITEYAVALPDTEPLSAKER